MNNPFVYDRPDTIEIKDFIDFYIKDNIYTRFLESTRNIFLIGVRGSGKTSTLRYYSFNVRMQDPEVKNKFEIIGIHIPCNHPLLGKREYLLYENIDKQSIVVEHFLCINIINKICETLNKDIESLKLNDELEKEISDNLEFIFDVELPNGRNILERIKMFFSKEAIQSQKRINNDDFGSFIDFSFSFNNTVIPILEQFKTIPVLSNCHFSLFFDDTQDLGDLHKKIINSWISYRDNKLFSFKVATSEIKPSLITLNGGVILEGHDFIKIDLTKRIFHKDSEFSLFAKDVISKRLEKANIFIDVDEFLPTDSSFKEGLTDGREKARSQALLKFPTPTGTQIADYVAKYGRAIYFKERSSKANKPNYSGFETIVDVSTGVIRNLLNPIYYMYEKETSINGLNINTISPRIQKEVLISNSDNFWEKMKSIDTEIENCSDNQKQAINNFFNQYMIYLKKRLNSDISEPRAINFILTSPDFINKNEVDEIISICLRSTLVYKRLQSTKDTGTKVDLFIPNRIMLLSHGLDPHGQYSHISLKYQDFYNAAYNNREIPFFAEPNNQLELFTDE